MEREERKNINNGQHERRNNEYRTLRSPISEMGRFFVGKKQVSYEEFSKAVKSKFSVR